MSAMSNVAKLVCAYFSLGSPYVLRQALKRSGWPQTHSVDKGDSEVLILMCPAPECWGYACTPPDLVYVVLGTEPRLHQRWHVPPQPHEGRSSFEDRTYTYP